ncbi:SusC/RagA family TonB-linked outer membrane protein [Dysgonomonas massiliensis]|uniref:SusC/RagA family TonB-linked outer membrane protein n=1 Tax=Dysgonomonas massiliensis TaxID=2040292 RepID=UPI0016094E13|nr:TonB-dependent receptor [Dysgonomonas massiliensis]
MSIGNPKKLRTICFLMCLAISSIGFMIANERQNYSLSQGVSQQGDIRVTGNVADEQGEALIGVGITLKGSSTVGTATDIDGNYSITVPKGGILVFSYVGYESKEVAVKEGVNDVILKVNSTVMDEVVVVGYGTMKKSDITGAIASIDKDKISRQPVANVASALQGLATGVSVTSNSGTPGASATIRIRGVGTVNDADPLYVVDGMPVTDIGYLSTSDIQSMEVLKDASASAIYGSRGANGVILITTKKGSDGKAIVTFDAYWGVNKLLNNLDLMDGKEWYTLQSEINKIKAASDVKALDLSRVTLTEEDLNNRYIAVGKVQKVGDNLYVPNTNWMDAVSRSAFMHNYSLGISGGKKDDFMYNFGANYINQEGTIKRTEFERISLRQSTEKTVIKDYFTVGTNATVSVSNSSGISEYNNQGVYDADYGVISNAIRVEPVVMAKYKEKDANGNLVGNWKYGSSPYIDYYNPLASIEYGDPKDKKFTFVGNVYGEVGIIKGLKLKTNFGAEIRRNNSKYFSPIYFVSSSQQNNESYMSKSNVNSNYYTWENTLSYVNTFAEKHSLNVVLGYTNEWGKSESFGNNFRDFIGESPNFHYGTAALNTLQNNSNGASEYAMISYLGRVHYEFDNKYLLTASFRRDGSSQFAKENRWSNFPSFALGWRIDNEEFFKKLNANWISSLKLRAGWGQIGNQSIGSHQYLSLLSLWKQYGYLFGTNKEHQQGIAVAKLGNPNIKWETSESVNFGLDATFLSNRLIFSFEYYDKDTKDMLLGTPMNYYMGYPNAPYTNTGEANNRGIEFNLEWRDKINDFEYSLGFNMSTIRNRMTELNGGKPISSGVVRQQNVTYTNKGLPIGAFWGYKTDGLIQTQGQLDLARSQGQIYAELGDVLFVDTDGNDVLDSNDRVMIGNPIPDIIYGFNISAAWKGFDLNMQFGGTIGNDIYNAARVYTYSLSDITNKDRALLNYWTPENTNTNIPRLAANDANDNNRPSDRYVESGTYLRLRNVQFGYTLPSALVKKAMLQKVRLYVSGQNLFTVSSYSGIDPEVGQSSSLSRGVDFGIYPQSRVITGGVSITF